MLKLKKNLKSIQDILTFRLKNEFNQYYERVYYKIEYFDNREIVVFEEITNIYSDFEEEYIIVPTITDFFKEINENEEIDFLLPDISNACPKYVFLQFYNLDEDFKEHFKTNLENEIAGYTSLDFYEDEIEKINIFYQFVCNDENVKLI